MALPKPTFATPPEPFVEHFSETECHPFPKSGTVAFRDFVLKHQGGADLGIARPCNILGVGVSGHWAGRAWDWKVDANNPDDAARVDELLAWLLADDAEMFRRLGLKYIIWNRQRWSTYDKAWRPYTGPNPHTDHVHFSFGHAGADGETSFFRWLRGDELGPVMPPPGLPGRPTGGQVLALLGGMALGYGAVAFGVPWLGRRPPRW